MDNIPGMNHNQKKEEKRKGFLAWLRSRLGAGGRGAMGGAGEGGAGIGGRIGAGLGRTALGVGGRGASQGLLGGLLGGNMMSVLGYAVILAAVGVGFYYGTQDNSGAGISSSSFKKGGGATYIPAIMRQKPGGSSLDIFRGANKENLADAGSGAGAGEGDIYDQDGYDKDGYDKDGYDRDGYDRNGYDRDGYDKDGYDKDGYDRSGYNRAGYDRNGNSMDAGAMAGGGSQTGSRLGDMFGSSSGAGGSGGYAAGRGYGLQGGAGRGGGSARGGSQSKKLMAMRGTPKAVATSRYGARSTAGRGALGQSRAIRSVQVAQRGTYDNPAGMRANQDTAWTGSTDPGKSIMGTGLTSGSKGSSSGGSGSPGSGGSSSGVSGPGSSGGDDSGGSGGDDSGGSGGDDSGSSGGDDSGSSGGDETKTPVDVSPWAGLASTILKLVALSTVLAIAGAAIIKAVGWTGAGYYIGLAMCIAAAGLAVWAGVLAGQLMSQYGQMALGALYMAGAGLALAGALVAMLGSHVAATITMATWLGIAGGVCGLMGMYLGK